MEACGRLSALSPLGVDTECRQLKAKHRLLKANGHTGMFRFPSTCVCVIKKRRK